MGPLSSSRRRAHNSPSRFIEPLDRRLLLSTTVAIGDAVADENTPALIFPVTRSGDLASSLSLSYLITPRSARAAEDFSGPLAGVITFAPDQPTTTISIPLANDPSFEFNEELQVTLAHNFPSFSEPLTVASTHAPVESPQFADINADNRPDLVIARRGIGFSVVLNDTAPAADAASFLSQQDFPVQRGERTIVGDFNGDARPDVAVLTGISGELHVFTNNSPIGGNTAIFSSPTILTYFSSFFYFQAGDFNGDGRIDLALLDSADRGGLTFFLNTTATPGSAPTFTGPIHVANRFPTRAAHLVAADFNLDGRTDLAFNSDDVAVSVLINTTPSQSSSLSFAPRTRFRAGVSELAAGDLDGNNLPDLATASAFGSVTAALNHTIPGSPVPDFQRLPLIQAGFSEEVAIADLNNDGRGDIITGPRSSVSPPESLSVLFNVTKGESSNPVFAPPSPLVPNAPSITAIATADINADGRTDIFYVPNGNSVYVALNTTPPPTTDILIEDPIAIGTIIDDEPHGGPEGDDTFHFAHDPETQKIALWFNRPLSDPPALLDPSLNSLNFSSGAGNDTFTVDLRNGDPFSGLTPRLDAGPGQDRFIHIGPAANDDFGFNYISFSAGTGSSASRIEHTGFESAQYDPGDGPHRFTFSANTNPPNPNTLPFAPTFAPNTGQNTLTLNGGLQSINYDVGPSLNLPSLILTTGHFAINASQHLIKLSIENASDAVLAPGNDKFIRTQALFFPRDGRLDLTDNALILSPPFSLTTLRSYLLSGRSTPPGPANGTWNGPVGLISSTATSAFKSSNSESLSLGYAANADLPIPFSTFFGESVSPADLLVRLTKNADANLDGKVDDNDVSIVSGFYNPNHNPSTDGPRHWYQGDFTYDGMVDDDDVTLISGFYNPSAPPLAPSSHSFLATNNPPRPPTSIDDRSLFSTDSPVLA